MTLPEIIFWSTWRNSFYTGCTINESEIQSTSNNVLDTKYQKMGAVVLGKAQFALVNIISGKVVWRDVRMTQNELHLIGSFSCALHLI